MFLYLKIGDQVLIQSRFRQWIGIVKRITKTQIIMENGDKYNIFTGHPIGGDSTKGYLQSDQFKK